MIDINRCPECGSENVSTFPNPHDLAYYGHYRYHCRECKRSWQAPPQEQKPPMTTADELAAEIRADVAEHDAEGTMPSEDAGLEWAHILLAAYDAMTAERDALLRDSDARQAACDDATRERNNLRAQLAEARLIYERVAKQRDAALARVREQEDGIRRLLEAKSF